MIHACSKYVNVWEWFSLSPLPHHIFKRVLSLMSIYQKRGGLPSILSPLAAPTKDASLVMGWNRRHIGIFPTILAE